MIEKIIKVVKSNNKKRGRNITIGAVVGMLLSYTAVMGAGEIGLEIGISGDEIKFSKDGTEFIPEKEEGTDCDPYIDNSWDEGTKIYTNNAIILGNNDGLGLAGDLRSVNLINNSSIIGGTYGIYNSSKNSFESTIGDIINSGRIFGGSYYGIYNFSKGSSESAIGDIINSGSIFEENSGVYNTTSGGSSSIGSIINSGIIYGGSNAIKNEGTIGASYNYGLLISGSADVVEGISIVAHSDIDGQNKIKNYGLAFTADGSGFYS